MARTYQYVGSAEIAKQAEAAVDRLQPRTAEDRDALLRAGLTPPSGFSYEFEFRRCERCQAINILKLDMPECGEDLPPAWNFASP